MRQIRSPPTTSARTSSRRCSQTAKRWSPYRFEGYWKDVGTIESLWEANMDLLSPNSGLNLSDDSWKIYGRTTGSPPALHRKGREGTAYSAERGGCEIAGQRFRSRSCSPDVKVAKNANVEYSILMPGAVVEEGANALCHRLRRGHHRKGRIDRRRPVRMRRRQVGALPLSRRTSASARTSSSPQRNG